MERWAITQRVTAAARQVSARVRPWLVLGLIAVALSAPAAGVRAAEDDAAGSFLTPFPENDVYQLTLLGDWYADELLEALVEAVGSDARLNVSRKVKRFSGIMAADFKGKADGLSDFVAAEPMHIAIIIAGQEDRVSVKSPTGKRAAVGSPEWVAEYGRRLDTVMKALRRKNAGVYWVGLPTLARSDANEQFQKMNDVIRERAYLNGVKYIDILAGFADESGGYSAYGPDIEGKIRLLRNRDGVSFTRAGRVKLAHFVEQELRRDLTQARASRTIPLLGADEEQSQINPDNAIKTPAPSSPVAATQAGTATPIVKGAGSDGTPASASGSVDANGDQKADNGRITLKVAGEDGQLRDQTVEIVRPSIPASVVALMARRQGGGQRGDLLVDQIAGGLTLMSSVTPAGSKAGGKISPTQAPYFRLLVKGERLQPKPGRADDTSLPGGEASSDARGPRLQPKG